MIINAHAHALAWPKIKKARAGKPDATFMSAADKIAQMDTLGVDKAIILPLNNAESPIEHQSAGEILYICQKYPGRFIPFCNVDPRLPRRPDMITVEDFDCILSQYKELGFKGLGEITARVYFDDPSLVSLFKACEKVGFPVTIHTITADIDNYGLIDEIGLPRLERVLQECPDLRILGHSAGFWSEIAGNVTIEERNGYPNGLVKTDGAIPRLMRKYPNLYGDISAGSGYNALTRDPKHAYRFIDEFQNRLLLGLDYNFPDHNLQHIDWLKTAKNEGHISELAYERITWKNIDQLLNLGLE